MNYTIMKTLIIIATALFSITSIAQDSCSKYYPFGEGSTSKYEILNKKGKSDGSMIQKVSNVSNSEGKITATVNSELFDKKGEPLFESQFEIICNGSMVTMDFKSLINADMMKQFNELETEITGTNVEVPNDLSEGQTLPDAGINIKMNIAGMNMNMDVDITDRKVLGFETITTPAGTFDCAVISQLSSGKVMMKFSSTQKFWLAEGVGLVKSEDYNRSGKLQGTTELTAFSK
jgi:hypothetical protein